MRKYLIGMFLATLLMVPTVSQAATYTLVSTEAETKSMVQQAVAILNITAVNAGGSAVTVKFFDAPTNNLTFVLGEYTKVTPSVINVTNIYTDALGVSVTDIYPAITNTVTTVAASTNDYRTITSMVVPAGQTIQFSPASPIMAMQGILATNSGAITIHVNGLQIGP